MIEMGLDGLEELFGASVESKKLASAQNEAKSSKTCRGFVYNLAHSVNHC